MRARRKRAKMRQWMTPEEVETEVNQETIHDSYDHNFVRSTTSFDPYSGIKSIINPSGIPAEKKLRAIHELIS